MDDENVKPKGLGFRHVQFLLLFFDTFLLYAFRANLSVAIVMMTDKNNPDHFDWSLMTQSIVLSSFYWGYVVLQVAGGELAKRFGGKILLVVPAAIDSTILIFLPTGARLGGWKLVCVCRLIQGLGQGVVFPAMYQLVGQWIPLQERGTFVSVIFSGAHLGVAFQLAVSGFIAYSLGWPSIFYVTGAIGIVWVCAYMILGSDSPEKSRYISNNELLYIQKSLGARKFKRYPTPWLKINTSLPFWALVVAHCGQNWGYFTLMAEMPTYMAKVLGVDIKTNGVLSSLPYLTMFAMAFVFGALTDVILKRNWLNVTKTRKLFNSIATIGAAIGLIGLAYTPPNNKVLAEVLLIIALGFSVGQLVGFTLVHMDMSPNFRATMMGITNTWSNIVSVLGPLFCGLIVKDETNYLEWRAVFYVSAAVYFGCNLFFVLFGTSKRQPWNEPKEEIATSSNASRQGQSVK